MKLENGLLMKEFETGTKFYLHSTVILQCECVCAAEGLWLSF